MGVCYYISVNDNTDNVYVESMKRNQPLYELIYNSNATEAEKQEARDKIIPTSRHFVKLFDLDKNSNFACWIEDYKQQENDIVLTIDDIHALLKFLNGNHNWHKDIAIATIQLCHEIIDLYQYHHDKNLYMEFYCDC